MFLVDTDDPTRGDYLGGLGAVQLREPTGDPTGPLNAAVADSTSAIVGFTGDDSRFETVGWDEEVLDALVEPGFCWGGDGHDGAWPSTVFISKIIPQTLGWMVPPVLKRGFFDVVWVTLAKGTATMRVIPEVLFPHDNSKGDPSKPNFDPAYQVPPEVIASDEKAYHHWFANEMPQAVRTLRQHLYA